MRFDNTLMNCVQKDLEKNLIPMLLGEPGIGKSSWLSALATKMHTKCFVLACNQLADKADLTGARLVPTIDANGEQSYKQVFYPHAVIHDAITYAEQHPRETPILFLDELNRTTPDVTSEALSIPTMRSIGSMSLPNNLRVVIAGNDKGNVTALDEASISRFVLYRTEPDVDTFLQVNNELNPFVKNVLLAHPECIFCKTITETDEEDDGDDDNNDVSFDDIMSMENGMQQITTPRTITCVSDWLNTFTNTELTEMLHTTYRCGNEDVNALQEAIEGHIGKTNFASYLISEIVANINTISNQGSIQTVGKPAVYDQLKQQTTIDDLNELIETLNDNDKSGCLLYALYEKEDNDHILRCLAQQTQRLTNDDMKALMSLSSRDELDHKNVQTFLDTNTLIAGQLNIVLSI